MHLQVADTAGRGEAIGHVEFLFAAAAVADTYFDGVGRTAAPGKYKTDGQIGGGEPAQKLAGARPYPERIHARRRIERQPHFIGGIAEAVARLDAQVAELAELETIGRGELLDFTAVGLVVDTDFNHVDRSAAPGELEVERQLAELVKSKIFAAAGPYFEVIVSGVVDFKIQGQFIGAVVIAGAGFNFYIVNFTIILRAAIGRYELFHPATVRVVVDTYFHITGGPDRGKVVETER